MALYCMSHVLISTAVLRTFKSTQTSASRLSSYNIRKYVLPIWSEHDYIFSHRIVHWVYNYMFRSCILAIVRLYCNLNKQLYCMAVCYIYSTTWRWPIYRAETCSFIPNVLFYV